VKAWRRTSSTSWPCGPPAATQDALFDVPLGTVKSRIHSARNAVRPLLKIPD
jgi:hypothetical protein